MTTVKEQEREKMQERTTAFTSDSYDYDDPQEHPPDLDRFYGTLRNFVKMVVKDYRKLFMLDASGGLGKTHNVRAVLGDHLRSSEWTHIKGFTTPLELYKTLYMAQSDGHVLFLDDMSGIRNRQKAIDMLKAATDSEGAENWVEYSTSQEIDHPEHPTQTLPSTFCFRGNIIMSFNDTPDNEDFNALKDRATYYEFDLTYPERIELIREAAKLDHFSELTVSEQQEVAEWVADVTNPAIEVSLRTFEEVCDIRHYGQREGVNWQEMAYDVFDLDYERHLIIRLRQDSDLPVGKQIDYFKDKTDRGRTYYYELLEDIKDDWMED
jgi:hypothetical protein